jgi:hypothetical protein
VASSGERSIVDYDRDAEAWAKALRALVDKERFKGQRNRPGRSWSPRALIQDRVILKVKGCYSKPRARGASPPAPRTPGNISGASPLDAVIVPRPSSAHHGPEPFAGGTFDMSHVKKWRRSGSRARGLWSPRASSFPSSSNYLKWQKRFANLTQND